MRKKTVANLVMVILIVAIVIAGVFWVGYIQGWFETADGAQAVLQDIRGGIDLQRKGASYPVTQDTVLHVGDKISCQSGATAVICIGDDRIALGEKASVTVQDPAAEAFRAQVHTGEAFAHCDTAVVLSFEDKEFTIQQTTVLLSVRSGAQSLSVLRGAVDGVTAGQILQFVSGERTVGALALNSLNDFAISQIRGLRNASLCFTAEDLDRLAEERAQALEELINGSPEPSATLNDTDSSVGSTESTKGNEATETTKPNKQEATPPVVAAPPETTAAPETIVQPETTPPPEATAPPAANSCTIAIYCSTILDNMGDLEPGKVEFVPGNGVILSPVAVNFADGETVFDVLKRVCNRTGIQIEYSWTPLYNSYYVEGINNLYEFDCGYQSGWMYKVNGWFPNYGCSSYTLQDGDVIVWSYTCKGLGTDVGAPGMG